ncbi:MAG: hypothetical protein F2881_08245, partial [Actinobacteria bacterium]|nr:hypothetical protein [Actinomycetota bacterium]
MRSSRMRPVVWSTSYLLRLPAGISTSTSNSMGSMWISSRGQWRATIALAFCSNGAASASAPPALPGDRPFLAYSQEVTRRPAAAVRRAVSLLVGLVAVAVVGSTSLTGAAANSASAAPGILVPPIGAPVVLTPVAVEGSTAKAPVSAKVAAAVAPSMDSGAWDSVSAMVLDPANGRVLYDSLGSLSVTPASTLKIVTSLSVLTAVGPDTRLRTRVVLDGSRVVLIGGGDATLTRSSSTIAGTATASVDSLAEKTAAALRSKGITSVSARYDDSLFSGPSISPAWNPSLVESGVVAP